MDNNYICNCENCPYNINASAWPGNRLPCGQFVCWDDPTLLGEDDLGGEYEDDEVDLFPDCEVDLEF